MLKNTIGYLLVYKFRMKILHFITGLQVGGAEKMLLRTLPKLEGEHIVCSIIPRAPIGELLEQSGIKVEYLNIESFLHIGRLLQFIRLIKKEKPDILVTYLLHADIIGRIIGKITRIPIIVCSLRCAHQDKKLLIWIDRITSSLVNHYIALSEAVAQWATKILKVNPKHISVITNGIDIDEIEITHTTINSINKEYIGTIISYIGRLDPQKGITYLLEGILLLRKSYRKPFTVLLIGDGPLKKEVQQIVSTNNLDKIVKILGFQKNIPLYLAKTDIVISPTLFEGMSNSLLEAMAAGKPIITTDIPENRPLIQTGINGILVAPRDAKALADAMKKILDDPAEAARLGQAARSTIIEDFNIATSIEKLDQLFSTLYTTKVQSK